MSDAFNRLNDIPNSSIEKVISDVTGDPQGQHPKAEYWYGSSLPKGNDQLDISGDPTIDILDIMQTTTQTTTDYTAASIKRTAGGHVLLFDDKHGARRILLKHKNGTGIEMRNDGTMVMRTETNMITSVGGSGVLMVEGDLKVSCKNLEIDATGDLDLRVDGDYNLNVKGDKREFVQGISQEVVKKNKYVEVVGNLQTDVVGKVTNAFLGDVDNVIKGTLDNNIEGGFTMSCKGSARFTSQTKVNMAAPNYNITSEDLTMVGSGGTIGGTEMIYYGSNAIFSQGVKSAGVTATAGMTAPTFTGDVVGNVNGIAKNASNAGTAETLTGGAAVTAPTYVGTPTTATDIATSEEPTAALMQTALKYSLHGYRSISIDEDNGYKNKIDLHQLTGQVTDSPLSIRQIRAKLKDTNNENNTKFKTYLEANNMVAKDFFVNKVPPGVSRSYDGLISYIANEQDIGVSTKFVTYLKGKRQNKKFIPDTRFNPMRLQGDPRKIATSQLDFLGKAIGTVNTGKALLGIGIPISTFLINGISLRDVTPSVETRLNLARQLLLQAEVIKFKRANDQFKSYQLTVTEGVYKKYRTEILQDSPASVPYLAQTGRAISYELHDLLNKQSSEVSFNFARRLADSLFGYDKIILNYDTLEENKLNIQIIVVMPEVDEDYNPAEPSKFQLETRYNNQVLSADDLIEVVAIEPTKSTKPVFSESSEKILYAFNQNTVRDKKVNSELEKALEAAAVTAGLDYVEIYSGKQPGTDLMRTGSTRHDTGLAAQVRLIRNGKPLSSANLVDRRIMTKFVKAAIVNGILGGGHGPEQDPKYLDNFGMHLDMLGAFDPKDRQRTGSSYDKKTKFLYRSDDWFYSAFGLPIPNKPI